MQTIIPVYRTLKVLTIAQAFAQTGAPIVVLLGGITGASIAPTPDLATLPVAFMIIGTASTTIPAALFMAKYGRKAGFMLAAFMGPEAAQRLRGVSTLGDFAGSFLGLSGFMLITLLMLSFYKNANTLEIADDEEQRGLRAIVRQPMFMLAICAAVVAWSVMSLLMTATPVSMHTVEHFNLEDTAWIIQSHIVAMFLPSLFSGFLVDRLGAIKIIIAGLALLFACLFVAYLGRQLMFYWWALVLLGVGWNFLFLGGTTLLTQTYRQSERFKVQALNDFIVFSMQATAALGSGFILVQFGWNWLAGLSLPLLLLLIAVLFYSRNRAEMRRRAPIRS